MMMIKMIHSIYKIMFKIIWSIFVNTFTCQIDNIHLILNIFNDNRNSHDFVIILHAFFALKYKY